MSQNPWPLLLVGLGSFGFLAASMAQQTASHDFSNEVPPASIQIPDFDDLDFDKSLDPSANRWSKGDGDTNVRLGADIEDNTNRPAKEAAGRPLNEFRRFADGAGRDVRDTQPETAQIREIRPSRSWDGVRQKSTVDREPVGDSFAERGGSLGDEEKLNTRGPLFNTRETAILGDPPGGISANRSTAADANRAPQEEIPPGDEAAGYQSESTVPQGSEQTDGEADDTTAAGKLRLWSSMALVASIAANLFFCWIAWDAHSKYQDLVEDISESDTRLERQAHQLRNEDGHSRRTRAADDSDFLQAGVEG